jgi:hypothetical protein
MPHFTRNIGIDYSGAETAESSSEGIRLFMAKGSGRTSLSEPNQLDRRVSPD